MIVSPGPAVARTLPPQDSTSRRTETTPAPEQCRAGQGEERVEEPSEVFHGRHRGVAADAHLDSAGQ
jgi:hypothetical protein